MTDPVINVFCDNRGWLFEDLKHEIAAQGAVASDAPIEDADAWICMRSREFIMSPDSSRTVVQIHDMRTPYMVGVGMISFVHPAQQDAWIDQGFNGFSFVRPIGARRILQGDLPDRPTIGFFCREYKGRIKGSLEFAEAVRIAREDLGADFDVLMIGGALDHIAHLGRYEEGAAGPDDYQRIDALVTMSKSVMVPLSCYEALAIGRRVLSTPRQWVGDWEGVTTWGGAAGIAQGIANVVADRRIIETSNPRPFCRTDWARRQVEEARRLVTTKKGKKIC